VSLRQRLAALLLLLAALLAGRALAGPAYVAGEVVVKYRSEPAATALPLAARSTRLGRVPLGHLRLLRLSAGVSMDQALAVLRRDPNVVYAEPNYLLHKSALPNDTRINDQWALTNMAASLAWDLQTGSSDVIVAVLDTGVDYTHPDLSANMWQNDAEAGGTDGVDDDGNGIVDDVYGPSYNGASVAGDPMDDDTADSHGTHVAGIIGAVGNNETGVAGVAWHPRLMAVKFLHGPDGYGTAADAVKGVDYALAHGARIINMSFDVPEYSYALEDAINKADTQGVLVVSAAGNGVAPTDTSDPVPVDLGQTAVTPGSIRSPNNIAVAAVTVADRLASYSNFGATTVDVAAPGGSYSYSTTGILSTMSPIAGHGDYNYLAGTSMAAPQVSGIAALVWSQYPTLDQYQVKARILNSVDALPGLTDKTISGGRVNAYNALVNPARPAVFKVTPATVTAGGEVTISGANFGASTGTVAVAGVALTVVSWDAGGEQVVATVPTSATSGKVQVNGEGSTFPLVVEPATSADPAGSGSDRRCFIATAAYGSPLHPKVAVLRRFRDVYLLPTALGRALVAWYYRLSPPLAAVIRHSPRLKQAVVWALTPVVAGAEGLLAMSGQPPQDAQLAAKPVEILVRFKATVPEARRAAIFDALPVREVERLSGDDLYLLRLDPDQDGEAVLRRLSGMEEVDYAEPNRRLKKSLE
jgi:subtilisin family serine protease